MDLLLLGVVAALLANLPFANQRLLGVIARADGEKPFAWRALEWLLGYALVLALAWLLERRLSPPQVQNWQFYVTTLCLFAVLAWPGFVWHFFWRKPEAKPEAKPAALSAE